MGIRNSIIGTITTVVIGGGAYAIHDADVVKNFAKNTGMTQEQAQQYVNSIDKSSLASFDKIGEELVSDGNDVMGVAKSIDCTSYEYEWESATLSCTQGIVQLNEVGAKEISLGTSYEKLSSDKATKDDISTVLTKIDTLNASYKLEIVRSTLDMPTLSEIEKTNLYNRSILEAALSSK